MINFADALEMLKTARLAADQFNDAVLKQHLLDLQGQLLHLQVQVLEQQLESRELQGETRRLRDTLAIERKLERVFDAYFIVEGPDQRRGPFCARCWREKETLLALVEGADGIGYCSSCKETPRFAPPRQNTVNAS